MLSTLNEKTILQRCIKVLLTKAYKYLIGFSLELMNEVRGGSRTAATSKMKHFVIMVNGWKTLTIITKRSILDAAAVLDPPVEVFYLRQNHYTNLRNLNVFTTAVVDVSIKYAQMSSNYLPL